MDLKLLIASRIGKRVSSNGKLSRISNTIATLSVGISIAVMILSIAISNGFRNEIREKTSGFSGDITLSAPGVDITNHLYPIKPLSFIGKLDSLPYIKRVAAVAYRTAILKSDDAIQGVMFKGVDGNYDMEFFAKYLQEGSLPDYSIKKDSASKVMPPSNDIMISRRLADMLGYKVGEKALAYFVDDNVQLRRFTIKGIFNAQLDELDKALVIADVRHISRVNGWKNGEVSGYEIVLDKKSRASADECAEGIEKILYENTADEDDSVAANTLEERFYILFDWLHLLDMNVLIILALMMAVAGFNMVSGLLIMLFERISQIGLFKALGMKDGDISKVFLYRSSFIVAKGMLIGDIIAILFCWLEKSYKVVTLDPSNYFVSYVPIDISVTTIIALNVAAFLLMMLILMIPCHMISRISPAKTLVVK